MFIHITKLFDGYQQLKPLVATTGYGVQDFSKLSTIFEEKIQNPDISIMVYGVYNAGKSTLINAIAGKEVAEMGDIPLTDKVTNYQCGAFKITDTPGIDAPKQHEETTHEHLIKADIVIFVVNPLGAGEEQKTLSTLMGLVEKRKKVFLVFNDKNQMPDDDYIKLKDQTYQILQDIAEKRGLTDTLKHIPIIKINAKTALKAKLETKPKLLEHSGYVAFEHELNQFIEATSQHDICQRLESELTNFITTLENEIKSHSVSELVKKYDILLLKIASDKIQTREVVFSLIEDYKRQLYQQVKSWLYNEDPNFTAKLEDWFKSNSDIIDLKFKAILENLSVEIQHDINKLQIEIPKLEVDRPTVDIDLSNTAEQAKKDTLNAEIPASSIDANKITSLATTLSTQIKPEHIVTGLQTLKSYLPTLMKGVGTKTMEKWAGQAVGKIIPFAGVAISIGMAAKDLLSEDESTKALRQEKEAMDKARELRERKIEDYSNEISNQFSNSLTIATNQTINEFFDHISNELNSISQRFGSEESKNTEYLGQLMQIKQNLYQLL